MSSGISGFSAFSEVARSAAFIWSMIQSAQPYYGQLAPCAFVELGYSSSLVPPHAVRAIQPEADFGFFGLRTPYREQIMSALAARGVRVAWPERLPDTAAIQRFIATTRIGLNFRQSDRWPIPSPTRLGRYLLGRRLLVSEHTQVPTRQGELVRMAPLGADFIDWCLAATAVDWKSEAEQAFDRYRTTMPMAGIMEQALDTTLPPGGRRTDRHARRIAPAGLTVEPAPGDPLRQPSGPVRLRRWLAPRVRGGGR